MVLLCWSIIASDIETRVSKADLREFIRLVSAHLCVWRIELDTERLMFDDPNPENQHLVLELIDYHTDCTDPAELEVAQNNLEEVYDAFVDAMLSGREQFE